MGRTLRVLRRSFPLFVLGLIYYGGTSSLWPEIRLLGVLQHIALCYLFVSLLFLTWTCAVSSRARSLRRGRAC